MKKGIISYGEAFIDYIAIDQNNDRFNRYLGGTTINVAVGVRRLGSPASYLCKKGTDETSDFVVNALKNEGVDVSYSKTSPNKQICRVYIHRNEQGDRYFHTYIDQTPDEQLQEDELDAHFFHHAAILYVGSGTLFNPISRQTTKAAIELAKNSNTLVAFDANIRMKRWESEQICRETIKDILPAIDVLKLSDEELLFLMQSSTIEAALQKLTHYHIPFIWITKGENGAIAIHNQIRIEVAVSHVDVVDTTGAGDAFMAGILHCIDKKGLPTNIQKLREYTEFANKLGAITCTKQGSLSAFT
ncbi:carbohydrate kinase family protein [Ornithinibacillus xuwenensis]|uniref:Carbohydrate kinase n=1 Tax=Ornithinibacillus xuwenensis TaxID=3144668 RepID=A0ABU9XHE7_9BACI